MCPCAFVGVPSPWSRRPESGSYLYVEREAPNSTETEDGLRGEDPLVSTYRGLPVGSLAPWNGHVATLPELERVSRPVVTRITITQTNTAMLITAFIGPVVAGDALARSYRACHVATTKMLPPVLL